MIITECGELKDDNRWSDLPTLLLWMIKSRLDYPNGVRFASVCKHWLHASKSYPLHFKDEYEIDNSPPWIMFYENDLMDTRRGFISLLTKEHYTIDHRDFSASHELYSRQGWILLFRMKHDENGNCFDRVDRELESPYLLLNPFKNMKIKLPFFDLTNCNGAFTIQDGDPHCIVLAKNNVEVHFTVVVYLTYRGDNVWQRYSYTTGDNLDHTSIFVRWLFIIGNVVYIATLKSRVFVFNIANVQWKDLMLESNELSNLTIRDEQYMMLTQGEILRILYPKGVSYKDADFRKANCYKLNTGDIVHWELIDDCILARTCFWFLNRSCGHSFVARVNEVHDLVKLGKGARKMYSIEKLRRKNTFALCRCTNLMWVHMC